MTGVITKTFLYTPKYNIGCATEIQKYINLKSSQIVGYNSHFEKNCNT